MRGIPVGRKLEQLAGFGRPVSTSSIASCSHARSADGARGDFFAGGSHGQRIYVDPSSNTIIVQLANDIRHDFPFRRIVAYLTGKSWEYPRLIPALIHQAATNFGVDSIRPMFRRFMDDEGQHPERYTITENGMNTIGVLLLKEGRTVSAAVEVYKIITEHYSRSARGFLGLAETYTRAGNPEQSPRRAKTQRRLLGHPE